MNLQRLFFSAFCFVAAGFVLACTQNQPSQVGSGTPGINTSAAPDTAIKLSVATFANGCFWCSEGVFEQLKGVVNVVSGYSGGEEKNPTYRQVSAGATGHAESIQVWYHPNKISYPELLEVFFASHDPTTLNRQGPDVGAHYRSVIFYRDTTELWQAKKRIQELNQSGSFANPIVTELVPFKEFWVAEDYHQDYYIGNSADPYMRSVFQPKLKKVQEEFKDKLKE